MSLSISLATLVKYNNGFFKSEKQAAYLLGLCDNNTYTVGASSQYAVRVYTLDSKGVTSVKVLAKKPYTFFDRVNTLSKLAAFEQKKVIKAKLLVKMNSIQSEAIALIQAKFNEIELDDIATWSNVELLAVKGSKLVLDLYNQYEVLAKKECLL